MNRTLITRGVPLVVITFLIISSIIFTKKYISDSTTIYDNEEFYEYDDRADALAIFNADRIVKVSYSNQLWQSKNERTLKKAQELIKELKTISQVPVVDYEIIFDKYIKIIGINGIISAIVEALEEVKSNSIHARLSHYIGNYAVIRAPKLRDAMEVVIETPEMPTNAPLHGAVMEAIVRKNETNDKKIFDFIDNELCFMKNLSNADSIYQNCIHGVGHGLQLLFKDYNKTTQICSFYTKGELAYSCGGGVFMADSNALNLEITACIDINRFAPTCYRVLRNIYGKYEDFACNWIDEKYHRRSCYWGLAQNSKNATFCLDVIASENDYLTCIDGVLTDSPRAAQECDFIPSNLSNARAENIRKLCSLRMDPQFSHNRYPSWVLRWFEEDAPYPMDFGPSPF